MIAQFYNKFDELHEQSLSQALARSPDKVTLKNEVKYRVPQRWTKPFHKEDILGNDFYLKKREQPENQLGFINKRTNMKKKPDYENREEEMIQKQLSGQVAIVNPILSHSLSQSKNINEEKTSSPKAQSQSPGQGGDSTDAHSRTDQSETKLEDKFGAHHNFDWSSVAYLFEKGEIPEEIAAITDPVEYNYLMVRLRKEFNDKHKSQYLKYMALNLPYHSRRDEVGGSISETDWNNFVTRLEGIIEKVKRKRARIVKRRKKRGKKKMPRKTLFKPEKQLQVGKDPLWREIFIDKQEEGSSESESDGEEEELMRLYREACAKKGIKVSQKTMGDSGHDRSGARSAKVELWNRETTNIQELPPIEHPSMHPREKPLKNYLEISAAQKYAARQKRIETANK